MATGFTRDSNHNHLDNGDPEDLDVLKDTDEALTAEFRHRVGLLDDEDDPLTNAFKARIGLLGEEPMGEQGEIEMRLAEEKDKTLNIFKFSKFAKDNFNPGCDHHFSSNPEAKIPLLKHKQDVDILAAKAIWVAILKYSGNIKPERPAHKSRTPIMTKIYRTLEAHSARKTSTSSEKGEPEISGSVNRKNMESFKIEKKSSWKKIFKSDKKTNKEGKLSRQNSTTSNGSTGSGNDESQSVLAPNIASLLESIPDDELDIVHFIIGHGILRKELRDETFCQLIKQLHKPPNTEHELAIWMLLALCIGCFVPSDRFISTLRCFLKDCPSDYLEYSRYARRIIKRTLNNGMRFHPPNWLEYQATKMRKYVMLPVAFADGNVETVEADSATTASEMCNKLAEKIGLRDDFGFSVYICIYDKVSSLGSGQDHVMDAISECEQVVRSRGKPEEDAPWRLYFRKEMFAPWHNAAADEVATRLIYKQLCRGVRSEEYKHPSEDDLCKFVACRWFAEQGQEIVPGKLQQSLKSYLPSKSLTGSRSRDGWTQGIIAAFEELGFSKGKTTQKVVKEEIVKSALKLWPLQFAGLFEAFKISGPKLNKNDIVLGIAHTGVFILDEPYKVNMAIPYFDIVEIFSSRTQKTRGQSFSIVTVSGNEFTFISPNSETITKLVLSFLDGLRRRSKFGIGVQEFTIKDQPSGTFRFRQGDPIELLDMDSPVPLTENWCYGRNLRNGTEGKFPFDTIYVLPTMEKPDDKFLNLFVGMSGEQQETLPRRRTGVVLSKGTIGRHTLHGKESAA